MKVSIVIPTHNRESALCNLLQDLGNQTMQRSDFEVIVVDSIYGRDVSGMIDSFTKRNLPVKIIITKNIPSMKRNFGAKIATGVVLIFLDDDMRVGRNFLMSHYKTHLESANITSGSVEFPIEWIKESNYYRYKNKRHLNEVNERTSRKNVGPQNFTTMNFSIMAVSYDVSGGFDESFTRYGGEDIEFGGRTGRLGMSHIYSAQSLAIHEENKGSISYFMNKIYTAAFYSHGVLVKKTPEVILVQTFRWTETQLNRSTLDNLIFSAADLLARIQVFKPLISVLRKIDDKKILYAPVLYKVLTIVVTRRAAIDRQYGEFNEYFK